MSSPKDITLTTKTISDVFVNRPIVWVPLSSSLEDAFKVLKDNRILALPVMNQNVCVGVVDVLDIVTYIVAKFPSIEQITAAGLQLLEVEGEKFGQTSTIADVIAFSNASASSGNVFVELSSPVMNLVDIFSRGYHRVPVIDRGSNTVLNFISQSDLLRYFAEHLYLLGNFGSQTVVNLDLVRGGVHYCTIAAPVILALSIISTKRVSALAVLDESGVLKATLSASDLKGIGTAALPDLLLPVAQYLQIHSPKSLYPLTCRPSDTLEYVMLKLAATKVHRLFCVDDAGKVIGVISITDVMKAFLRGPMEF